MSRSFLSFNRTDADVAARLQRRFDGVAEPVPVVEAPWSCGACTLENAADRYMCSICDTPKPTAPAATAAVAAASAAAPTTDSDQGEAGVEAKSMSTAGEAIAVAESVGVDEVHDEDHYMALLLQAQFNEENDMAVAEREAKVRVLSLPFSRSRVSHRPHYMLACTCARLARRFPTGQLVQQVGPAGWPWVGETFT
jgi:hypothetical protein